MHEKIMDIITIIFVIVIIAICAIVARFIINDSNKVYVQQWTCQDTGVSYLITNDSIIEMHNPDGSIYTVSSNRAY